MKHSLENPWPLIIDKVDSRLGPLYRQNKFLDIPLRRFLCSAMIHLSLIEHATLATLILTKT